MEIFYTREEIGEYLKKMRDVGRTIGLVPTMGALHNGHISLINAAKKKSDIVVCSIFVNPTQFTDQKDLDNYPRPQEEDVRKLEEAECDVVFLPAVEEMYAKEESWHIDLGKLDQVMEGSVRPGHYQGVTQIVKKLLDTVMPDFAFFGQKDYQQFMIISWMVKKLNIPVKLVLCPIVREPGGLAMSSRNVYLSDAEKAEATAVYKALLQAKNEFGLFSLSELKERVTRALRSRPGIEPEYFEVVNAETLEPVADNDPANIIALAAAKVGKIRIIDNMILK